jgi:hypothetical protein
LEDGVEAKVVECVDISLPAREFIRCERRFEFSEGEKSFLDEDEMDIEVGVVKRPSPQKRVDEAIDKLLEAIKTREDELENEKANLLEGIKAKQSESERKARGELEMRLKWENARHSERARALMTM